ncbi:MAG TPA: O-antigen ligase family protein, partial [Steroidobacteraceae bacterium]
ARTKFLLAWLNPPFVAFMVLAALSILWSIDGGITVRRVLRASTLVMICMGATIVGWHAKRFQNLVRPIMTTVLLASILLVLIDPLDAIHHSDQAELKDAWHGITMGKNILGSFASISIVLWLHAWLAKESRGTVVIGGIALGAVTLIMTRSATSLMATVFAVMFMLILLRSPGALRRYMPYLVAAFAVLILVYALAVLRLVPGMEVLLKPIAMLTGKDLTFTGRTAIWQILNEHIRLRPWLGSGYGAYWAGASPTSPSYEMLTRLYFYPSEGHNGYLDTINDLGVAGAICLLGYFAVYLRQALAMMRFDRYQGGLYLTLLFRGFMADMSESHWFLSLSVDFIIMSLATTALARGLLQHQLEKNSANQTPSVLAAAPHRRLRIARPAAGRLRRPTTL